MRSRTDWRPMDRAVAALGIAVFSLLGCPPGGEKLAPAAGLPQYQERAAVAVPGATVNPLGGNLLIQRTDLSIDTHLGTREIGAVYSSASGGWLWSFDIRYDGAGFVDPTGAFHDTSTLAPGDAIPGTVWVVVDADTVKTKGGLAHDFGADGRLRAVRYTSADYPRLAYLCEAVGAASRTVAVDQCMAPDDCEAVFSISYGGDGQLASIQDRAGRRVEVEYAGERLRSVRDALDTARGWPGTRYEYDGTLLTAVVSSEEERVEYGYAGGRVQEVRAIGAEHPTQRFDYYVKDDAGLYATRHVDPLGHPTWFRYDGQYRLRERESEQTGERLRLDWDGLRVAVETRPSGVVTRWSYLDDDVATEVQPSGNVVRWSYAAHAVNRDAPLARAPLEIADSLGLRERRGYDAAGRLVTVENGEGELLAGYRYAPDQTVASRTGPDGEFEYGGYGPHGHPTRIASNGVEIESEYDPVGNLRRGIRGAVPELGGVVFREYDEDRNPSRIAVADAGYGGIPWQPEQFVEIEHRSDGRRTRIARPGGGNHEFDYDALGRLIRVRERVDGAWVSTRFEYDAAGRHTAIELANGMRRETGYDAAGRIAWIRNLRAGVIESSVRFEYHGGRLRSLLDSVRGGVEVYSYDAAGRVEMVEYPDGEVLVQHHDLRSRKLQEVFATGSTLHWIDHAYDLADREVAVSGSGQPLLRHAYLGGRLVETEYGSGLVRRYRYQASNGLLEESWTEGPAGLVEETAITREGPGPYQPGTRITAVTTTAGGVSRTTTEQYALAPPVEGWEEMPAAGARVYLWLSGSDAAGYEYDALSNALGWSAYGERFEYNAEANRLLSATTCAAGTIDYAYDEAGFATSRRGVPLVWTASGRLASFGREVTLEWDALGRRVRSEVMGSESRWLFGGRVQADPAGLPVAIDLGEVRVDLVAGQHRYRHLDFRGNVKFVSDQQGEVRSHYRYDAYGLRRVHGSGDDPVRFAGGSQLGELMAMGSRIYDPAVGRFLSPDPVLQNLNQYAYTLGNPIWFSDPAGRDAESVVEGIAVGLAMGLATASLFFVASAVAAVLAGASFGAAGLSFAFWAARRLEGVGGGSSGAIFVGSSAPGPSRAAGGSGAGQSCSPTRLASVPGRGRLHWILIALQILLAPLLIRTWSAREPGDSR